MSSMNFFTSNICPATSDCFSSVKWNRPDWLVGRQLVNVNQFNLRSFNSLLIERAKWIWGGESTVSQFVSSSINGIITPCICALRFSLVLNEVLADESRLSIS